MKQRRLTRKNVGMEPLVNRVAVGVAERDTMLAVLCRNNKAYARALLHVDPERHFREDPVMTVVWHALEQNYDPVTGKMPEREALSGTIDSTQDNRPELLTDTDVDRLNELLDYAYTDSTWGDTPVDSNYWMKVGLDTLYKFLEEKAAQEVRENVKTRNALPADMPKFLDQYQNEILGFRGLKGESVSHRLADNDEWREKIQLDFTPVGVSFFDKFLGKGQVPREVYGILGPYGSCKTTMAVMLAAEAARNAYNEYRQAVDAGEQENYRSKMSFLVTYEDGKTELLQRVLGYVASVPRDTMEDSAFAEMSTASDLRPYEQKMFKKQLANGEPVMGEQERLNNAIGWLNDHLCIIDMTQEGYGSGGVQEISMIVGDILAETESDCGSVIIDYAGAMVKRMMSGVSGNLDDASMMRHHLGAVPLAAKSLLSEKYDCTTWVMHQLSGEANAFSPTTKVDHTNAAEAKNFAENLNFCFVMGKPTADNLVVLNCTKHRRRPPRESIIIKIDGGMNRVLDADQHYVLQPGRNQIVSRDDFERIAGPVATPTQTTSAVPAGVDGINNNNPAAPDLEGPPDDDDEFQPNGDED